MPRFQKRAIIIEAHQWFKNGDHPQDGQVGPKQEGRMVRYFRRPNVPDDSLCGECGQRFIVHGWIDTKEDGHRVCPGDWIITGVKGEVYPCKPDVFAASYDPVP